MKNIQFTLTPDKADALCSLLSMLDNENALTGLYRAIREQLEGRPYNYRIMATTNVHRVHKAQMLALFDKRNGSNDDNDEDFDDEEYGS